MKKEYNNHAYIGKCLNIYLKGGALFLIERIDTNEFLNIKLKITNSCIREEDTYYWSREISPFTIMFMKKEHGIKQLDVISKHFNSEIDISKIFIIEHEFSPTNEKSIKIKEEKMYSESEVEQLLNKMGHDLTGHHTDSVKEYKNWIKQNLK